MNNDKLNSEEVEKMIGLEPLNVGELKKAFEERADYAHGMKAPRANNLDRMNMFKCSRGHFVITIDKAVGTTPLQIGCPECMKLETNDEKIPMAMSSFYNVPKGAVPRYEWYKPNNKELKVLNKTHMTLVQHVKSGGLLLRAIEAKNDDPNPKTFKEKVKAMQRKKKS